jgi:hypothetical protein
MRPVQLKPISEQARTERTQSDTRLCQAAWRCSELSRSGGARTRCHHLIAMIAPQEAPWSNHNRNDCHTGDSAGVSGLHN